MCVQYLTDSLNLAIVTNEECRASASVLPSVLVPSTSASVLAWVWIAWIYGFKR